MTDFNEQIERLEKGLKASDNLRQQALTKKDLYKSQLEETEKELAELGTTVEDAEKTMEDIENQINTKLAEVEKMIPFDLLAKWNIL